MWAGVQSEILQSIPEGVAHGDPYRRRCSHPAQRCAPLSNREAHTIMSEYRHSYVRFQNHEYKVTWHPISKEVYVYWGTDRYAGKAYDMQEALDIALSWLNNHPR
jgi:hypothetical protein